MGFPMMWKGSWVCYAGLTSRDCILLTKRSTCSQICAGPKPSAFALSGNNHVRPKTPNMLEWRFNKTTHHNNTLQRYNNNPGLPGCTYGTRRYVSGSALLACLGSALVARLHRISAPGLSHRVFRKKPTQGRNPRVEPWAPNYA